MKKYIPMLILLILCSGFFFISMFRTDKEENHDQTAVDNKFEKVPEENVYDILSNSEVDNFLEEGTGILILGTYDSVWTDNYLALYNELAIELDIEKINFFDILPSKTTENKTYSNILKKLDNYLYQTDEYEKLLLTPISIGLENGNIIFVNNDTAFLNSNVTPETYWSDQQILDFKYNITNNIMNMKGNE